MTLHTDVGDVSINCSGYRLLEMCQRSCAVPSPQLLFVLLLTPCFVSCVFGIGSPPNGHTQVAIGNAGHVLVGLMVHRRRLTCGMLGLTFSSHYFTIMNGAFVFSAL